jgi:hypothetical protein
MEKYFNAKVIKIEEGATYQNQVYDQNVCLELMNKQQIWFFDQAQKVKKDMLGKRIKVIARMLSLKSNKNETKKQEVNQTNKNGITTIAEVHGVIKDLKRKEKFTQGLLDAGFVKFYFNTERTDLKIGNYISFEEFGNELDISEIQLC